MLIVAPGVLVGNLEAIENGGGEGGGEGEGWGGRGAKRPVFASQKTPQLSGHGNTQFPPPPPNFPRAIISHLWRGVER